MSKEAKARTMDRWGQSLTYVASHHPREIERSTDTKKGYRRGARFSRADCEPEKVRHQWRVREIVKFVEALRKTEPDSPFGG
jgi:hypothetical protein